MTTPAWQGRVFRTSILSATLASLWSANSAPVLINTAYSMSPINEDDVSNSGTAPVFMMSVNSDFSDPDDPTGVGSYGLAIVGADTTHGSWEFTVNSSFGSWVPFGSVSDTHALLLAFTTPGYSTYIRFVPDSDFNGTISNAVRFRIWDESDGLAASDTSARYTSVPTTPGLPAGGATPRNAQVVGGGTSAYSSAVGTFDITVNAVNDAPRLNISGNPYLNSTVYTGATPTDSGTRLDVMLSRGANGTPVTDPDAGALTGIALVGADTTYGTWEYSWDDVTWTALPAVSATNAFLMNISAGPYTSGTDVRLRFHPTNAAFTGTITNAISFRAWDQTDFNFAGSQIDPTSEIGGMGAISVAVETASIFVTGTTSVVAPVVFPEPPVSTGVDTVYGAISPGTPEGLTSLLDAMSGKLPSDARAFSWDGVTQRFVELPSQPTVGLHPDTGFFLATRAPLPIDFAGSLSAIPYVLTLQPGWNLIGVPALDNAGTTELSHPWDDFQLVDDTGTPQVDPTFTDVLGKPGSGVTSTARPWYWDGSGYQQVTTLDTGKAYWIKNNSSVVYTLLRTATSQSPLPRLAQRSATAPRGTITDRGTPPRPPTAAAAGSSNGCGVGSGIGVLVLSMAGLLRGRRRS